MTTFETQRFARQVGFGLGPDEAEPADPLAWALAQLDRAPPVAFLANRQGGLMAEVPPEVRLIHTQAEVAAAIQEHWDADKDSYAKSRSLPRADWEALRFRTVEYPYSRLEPWKEVLARAAMAVSGPAPVFERFWHFWTNHFTVAPATNNINTAIGPYQRMLRTRMEGSFRDMLFEAVTHPAMVLYLDNDRSTGPRSKARRERWTQDEINENLGRELLELFTVSPAAGYTQADVLATAYILTGWGVQRPDGRRKAGIPLGSHFNYDRHEPGAQSVMGKSYSALLNNDGKLKELVDDLALHPATARHLCGKLATAFLADEPPPAAVQRLVEVFTRTRGDLPSLHKAVVQEVARSGAAARKFQNPETWLWTLFRVSGVPLPVVPPRRELRGERPHEILWELGQPVHNCPQPNGWPLNSREWISREMLDRRLRYAYQFSAQIPDAAAALRRQLERQLGAGHPLATSLFAAMAPGSVHTARSLWAAFLTSPEMLWS